jgi:hypothetical protein
MSDIPLYERVSQLQGFRERAKVIWDHYLSRQLPPGVATGRTMHRCLEPHWIHAGYEIVKKYAEWDGVGKYPVSVEEGEEHLLIEICHSHALKDGFSVPAFPGQPNSPIRVIHDGWKAGTPSWIFMGRALTPDSVIHLGAGYVAVQRTLPTEIYNMMDKQAAPATLWMAYHFDQQMGLTALTSNVIGPAVSFNQLWEAVDQHLGGGHLYKTGANDKYA